MNTYKILWDRNDYGTLLIKADTEDEAREAFETGEWDEEDLNIKNGGMEVVKIEKVKEEVSKDFDPNNHN